MNTTGWDREKRPHEVAARKYEIQVKDTFTFREEGTDASQQNKIRTTFPYSDPVKVQVQLFIFQG